VAQIRHDCVACVAATVEVARTRHHRCVWQPQRKWLGHITIVVCVAATAEPDFNGLRQTIASPVGTRRIVRTFDGAVNCGFVF